MKKSVLGALFAAIQGWVQLSLTVMDHDQVNHVFIKRNSPQRTPGQDTQRDVEHRDAMTSQLLSPTPHRSPHIQIFRLPIPIPPNQVGLPHYSLLSSS